MIEMKDVGAVRVEIKRLEAAMNKLEEAFKESKHSWMCPKERGSVRRASLDLTRVLADMRRV